MWERLAGEPELRCTAAGECVFLAERRCALHAAGGADAKPSLCRRYPFDLIATPLGDRVVTAHRCPCRSMGERAPLTAEDAARALGDAAGRLPPSREAPARVPLTARTTVSFASWAVLEGPLIARLSAGAPASDALGVAPRLPALRGASWRDVAGSFCAYGEHAFRGYQALAWFGDGILLAGGERTAARPRGWAAGFDHAEARSAAPAAPARVLGDWLADLVWDLSWMENGPVDLARASIGALAVVATAVTERMIELGLRSDRAAAEAVMVAEIAAAHPRWAEVVARMEPAPGGYRADNTAGRSDNRGG